MMKSHKFKRNKKNDKSRSRENAIIVVRNGHFIANCPCEYKKEKPKKRGYVKNKKFFKKRLSGEAHIGKEWDSMMRVLILSR